MKKLKKIIQGSLMAVVLGVVMVAPTFAAECTKSNLPDGLSTSQGGEYGVRCSSEVEIGGEDITLYGRTSADCAKAGSLAANPDGCEGADLTSTIQLIINMIIFIVGIVAVVMVILGGIQYSVSQGDAGKVKNAKNTIMYGIIGLVVAVLAFAIVNFVLSNVLASA